jgi:hypothetical protein
VVWKKENYTYYLIQNILNLNKQGKFYIKTNKGGLTMRKVLILTLALVLVFGMSAVTMAQVNGNINQDGYSNNADFKQRNWNGGYTFGDVDQLGDNNFTRVRQTSYSGWLNGYAQDKVEGIVWQDGHRNDARISQKTYGSVYGKISQVGNDNFAKIRQRSVMDNVSGTITQSGNGNTATLDQSNALCGIPEPECPSCPVFK